jgi:hypothetical protein
MVSGGGEVVVVVSCRAGSGWPAPVSCSQASAVVQVSSRRARSLSRRNPPLSRQQPGTGAQGHATCRPRVKAQGTRGLGQIARGLESRALPRWATEN